MHCRQGLEEFYATDRKRRRLVYALRRRHSDRCLPRSGSALRPAHARQCMPPAHCHVRSARTAHPNVSTMAHLQRCTQLSPSLICCAHSLPPVRAFTGTWDRLGNEAFIAGQLCFDWAKPVRMGDHLPWATALFVMVRNPCSYGACFTQHPVPCSLDGPLSSAIYSQCHVWPLVTSAQASNLALPA